MNTEIGDELYCSLAFEPPINSVSSSLTILMTCCWVLSPFCASCPMQRSVAFFTKSLTTL